jgi:hypothetical protein
LTQNQLEYLEIWRKLLPMSDAELESPEADELRDRADVCWTPMTGLEKDEVHEITTAEATAYDAKEATL